MTTARQSFRTPQNRSFRSSSRGSGLAACLLIALIQFTLVGRSVAQHYYAYVASESSDEVNLVHVVHDSTNTPYGVTAVIAQRVPVGASPSEIEGPHGVAVSPDGKFWFVTMAHGNPFGMLYKFESVSNRLVGKTQLGLFPATITVSLATGLLYAANFNLHGDMRAGTVSVVDPRSMSELAQVSTGIMPHGSRLSPDGLTHYSVSMMDGLLHEIDALTLERRRSLAFDHLERSTQDGAHGGHPAQIRDGEMIHSESKPTWVVASPDAAFVYVALSGTDRIAEVDTDSWRVTRELSTGAGPYNVAVSSDGKMLVATYKKGGVTGILDIESGAEIARIKNSRDIPHGVLITPDDRFAFVSVEGVGAQPGSVDVIDLSLRKLVASVDVGSQAGGISFWRQSDAPLELGSSH